MRRHQELRTEPRFSVNKLAEYVLATPTRRRALIVGQIEPVAYRVVNYTDARRVLARFCANPDRSIRDLRRSSGLLRDKAADPATDDFQRRLAIASARAIEAFVPVAYDVRVKGLIAVAGGSREGSLNLEGVRVVVTPDVYYLQKGTERTVGAAKLHFSRTEPLSAPALQYVATMLQMLAEAKGDVVQGKYCIAIDVFSGLVESLPRAVRNRVKNLEAACQEIAERWPSLLEQKKAEQDSASS